MYLELSMGLDYTQDELQVYMQAKLTHAISGQNYDEAKKIIGGKTSLFTEFKQQVLNKLQSKVNSEKVNIKTLKLAQNCVQYDMKHGSTDEYTANSELLSKASALEKRSSNPHYKGAKALVLRKLEATSTVKAQASSQKPPESGLNI
jgi:hypothetical protein